MNKHDGWLNAAGNARSFTRMYALALEISAQAPERQIRRAANDVVCVLRGVIDKPIADSRKLKEARRLFTVLLAHLSNEDEVEIPLRPARFTLRMSMSSS